jgi:hypothetical protein
LTTKNDDQLRVKGTILSLSILFFCTDGFSQQLSQWVFLPAAGVIYKSGVTYSQTIGETAVQMFTSPDYILTQGFQQPRVKKIRLTQPEGTGVNAYPNPVTEYVNIELFGETGRSFRIMVFNTSGIKVYSKDLSFGSKYWYIHEIIVSGLLSGLYFIHVFSLDGVIRRSFKIEKI